MSDILLLDNLDSFTYNLVDSLRSFHQIVTVYRNTTPVSILISALAGMHHPIVVLSPGPGTPSAAGCMLEFIDLIKGKIPILGICLGHQAIVCAYGGIVDTTSNIVHGKTSCILHDQKDMFSALPNPLVVARYHSLLCTSVPSTLCVNAHYKKAVMAVKHIYDRICGLQFHPESILTPLGCSILQHTLQWLRQTC
ncbi:Anthranilate synthase component 2 (plasmid) [Buchnera aphidicola (Cinara pseudotaxifoliae)]|uniref:anthranilate synthase n=1 Tax=Buchnera aphidicola (Cinara pseudotaxifoliae) TaxID=655384 RepID=A0A451DJ69_9GAMM|nr:gamma-glutamyl-gamma-aminobutyrate hydrolase family protein [Buchnera aphidicola]VFP86715.1 Anthranilate synthase component 2 [Buchnera aphidicola (Cinara pseudotaxifoliae)]VFP86719.1 Anthranilate synthase component 2 [Buchnera aphidicola (Cinara pseudotaxifoliae)]